MGIRRESVDASSSTSPPIQTSTRLLPRRLATTSSRTSNYGAILDSDACLSRSFGRFRPTTECSTGAMGCLSDLDNQIQSGDQEAVGLKTALFVQARSVTCQSCAAVLRLAMPDTGHPLVTASLLQTHQWIRDCPVCHKPLGLYVAAVL
jgi:hypothetical protein